MTTRITIPQAELLAALQPAPVLAILTVERTEDAAPLARALAAGGLRVVEIVLRTPVALDAIQATCEAVPELVVGVGSVRGVADLEATRTAGARFAVSPGLTPELREAGPEFGLVPGVATASEAMVAADAGFGLLKLFPAREVGGADLLRALAGPLPDLRFCPTGGVDGDNAADYLALPNVPCVGGSWLAPKGDVRAHRWDTLEERVRSTLEQLASPPTRDPIP